MKKKLMELISHPRIVVVQGQRRVGKSSLIINTIKHHNTNVFYLNKEYDSSGAIHNHTHLSACFDHYTKTVGDPHYIVIDEIQDIVGREKFIREKNAYGRYHIIITGSNSSLLSGELATYLTGRYMTLDVASLSYQERLHFTDRTHTIESFWEYCEYGGLPELCFLPSSDHKKHYCQLVLSDIILKDIVGRYRIAHPHLLDKILSYLASITGKICSLRGIATVLANDGWDISLNTLSSYISYLTSSYLITPVARYAIAGKHVLTHKDKYFFGDLGIKHTYGYNPLTDISGVLETLVYHHCIMMGYTVYVGEQGEKEIDFVCKKDHRIVYIQVAYSVIEQSTARREFGNLLTIRDNHQKIVVSMDTLPPSIYEGILWLSIHDFLATRS